MAEAAGHCTSCLIPVQRPCRAGSRSGKLPHQSIRPDQGLAACGLSADRSRRDDARPQPRHLFGGPTLDPKYVERPRTIASTAVGRHNHRDDSNFYTQPGDLFRLMKPQEKERLIGNIVASLSNAPRNIQERQLCHFFRADPAYGGGVAKTLGIYVQELGDAK
jgi:catalase